MEYCVPENTGAATLRVRYVAAAGDATGASWLGSSNPGKCASSGDSRSAQKQIAPASPSNIDIGLSGIISSSCLTCRWQFPEGRAANGRQQEWMTDGRHQERGGPERQRFRRIEPARKTVGQRWQRWPYGQPERRIHYQEFRGKALYPSSAGRAATPLPDS